LKRIPRAARHRRVKRLSHRPVGKKQRVIKSARQRLKPPAARKAVSKIKASEVGTVTHYFGKVKAAVVKLKGPLRMGDPILVKGTVTDFRQTVGSLQMDRKPIEKAGARAEVGLEVMRDVRPGDKVYVLKT
jgi:hypothetical protein